MPRPGLSAPPCPHHPPSPVAKPAKLACSPRPALKQLVSTLTCLLRSPASTSHPSIPALALPRVLCTSSQRQTITACSRVSTGSLHTSIEGVDVWVNPTLGTSSSTRGRLPPLPAGWELLAGAGGSCRRASTVAWSVAALASAAAADTAAAWRANLGSCTVQQRSTHELKTKQPTQLCAPHSKHLPAKAWPLPHGLTSSALYEMMSCDTEPGASSSTPSLVLAVSRPAHACGTGAKPSSSLFPERCEAGTRAHRPAPCMRHTCGGCTTRLGAESHVWRLRHICVSCGGMHVHPPAPPLHHP